MPVIVIIVVFGTVQIDAELGIFGSLDLLDVDVPVGTCIPHSTGIYAFLLFKTARVWEFGSEAKRREQRV